MKYYVSIPIAGTATFEVEAANAKAAKKKVWDVVESDAEPDVEWEYFETLCDGNVLHASVNEIAVTLICEASETGSAAADAKGGAE